MKKNKQDIYAQKIYAQLTDIFDEQSDNFISSKELGEGNNATDFIHAMSLAAALLYTRLTNDEVDILAFNHIQNRLILQNMAAV